MLKSTKSSIIKKNILISVFSTLTFASNFEAVARSLNNDYTNNRIQQETYERKKRAVREEREANISRGVNQAGGFIGELFKETPSVQEICTDSGGKGYEGGNKAAKISNCIQVKLQKGGGTIQPKRESKIQPKRESNIRKEVNRPEYEDEYVDEYDDNNY